MKMTQNWMAGALVLVGVSVAHAEVPALVVEQGVTSNLVLSSTLQHSAAQIHGILNLSSIKPSSRQTLRVNYADTPSTQTYIDLGPDVGDQGQFNVYAASIYGNDANTARCAFRVGKNGGGANARLSLNGWADAATYYTDFELCSAAQTDAEVFDVLTLDYKSMFRSTSFSNQNTKPMRVTFTNSINNADRATFGRIGGFWDSSYFKMPNAGGDIILHGSGVNAPIYFYSQQTNYRLFNGKIKGLLRTEGDCDVIFDSQTANKVISINATNLVWGHTGDFICTSIGGVRTDYSNVLPFGPNTGNIRVEASTKATDPRETLDLNGTTQCVNGVVLTNGGCVSNSATKVATLIFGSGNANGLASGNFKETNINYIKTGSGMLTLGDATFPSLVVDGGSLCVTGCVHVGSLALTNATLSINAAGGKLTYDTLTVNDNVQRVIVSSTTNAVVRLGDYQLDSVPIVKKDAGFITCETPADAHNAPLEVRAGVLRFGATGTTNSWWRFIARKAIVDSYTYTSTAVPSFSQTIYLALGSIGLFTGSGCYVNGDMSNGKSAATLEPATVASSQEPFLWSTSRFRSQYETTARDPILDGGTSDGGQSAFVTEWKFRLQNWYDVAATDSSSCKISSWASAVLYTNGVLRTDDPSTWVTNTWRMCDEWAATRPTSYSLRRRVNDSGTKDRPHVSDWTLESSPDGINWETMDVRSNQTFTTETSAACKLSAQFNFTYNAHIPYVFSAKNADWRFTTFGVVKVAAGATLDLSELRAENIAFNGLSVDMTAGAGTIKKFVPAETGTLCLTNVDGTIKRKTALPITLTAVAEEDRLANWKVIVDGEEDKLVKTFIKDGQMCVKRIRGLMVVVE